VKIKLFGILISVLLLTILIPIPVGAWTTSNLNYLIYDGDSWYNYDFMTPTYAANNVDWPVTALYYGNASASYLRGILWGVASNDTVMCNLIGDQGTYWDDYDQGSKSGFPMGSHIRFYAANGERSYCPSLGYNVVGTTHHDYLAVYGWTEDNSYVISSDIAAVIGWNNVSLNSVYMYNAEVTRWEDVVRYVQNDGYADFIYISG
jgi:hypothetical protein